MSTGTDESTQFIPDQLIFKILVKAVISDDPVFESKKFFGNVQQIDNYLLVRH